MIFESHAHYDDEDFDADREELLSSLAAHGIGTVINIGASLAGSEDTVKLAGQYPFIYGVKEKEQRKQIPRIENAHRRPERQEIIQIISYDIRVIFHILIGKQCCHKPKCHPPNYSVLLVFLMI